MVRTLALFVLLQSFVSTVVVVVAWNPNNKCQNPDPAVSAKVTRREWIASAMGLLTVTTLRSSSHAACLAGDLNTDCIGVYKIPIDDRVLPYVSTPQALEKFAPDIRYVPPIASPNSVAQAWEILETQRLAAEDIQQVVQAGKLEEAGIKVLNLVPKMTSSGRVVLEDSLERIAIAQPSSVVGEMTMNRLQTQWDMVVGLWGEADVMIGQGLRGEMGVSAAAQIQILRQLKDATAALDDFIASAASASGRTTNKQEQLPPSKSNR